jgi:hypothetical protein
MTTNGHREGKLVDAAADVGVALGWCTEEELEECKRETHDTLISQMGEHRAGPVTWSVFTEDAAVRVLDGLVIDEVDEMVFNYYRRLRACLREYGGVLVMASAPAHPRAR